MGQLNKSRPFALRILHVVATLALFSALAACTAALPDLGPDEVRRQQTVDDLVVTLDTLRNPQVDQTQTFRVTLLNRSGQAIDGADVRLGFDLSGADLPATAEGQGRYEAVSAYKEPGDWQVTVIVRYGDVERQARFQVIVGEA